MKRVLFLLLVVLLCACESHIGEPPVTDTETEKQQGANQGSSDSKEENQPAENEPNLGESTEAIPEYQFCDDYMYVRDVENEGQYTKMNITPNATKHYVRFTTEHQEDVIEALLSRGFEVSKPSPYNYDNYDHPEMWPDFEFFDLPDELKYVSTIVVKGEGNIDDIPNVIYSQPYYYGAGEEFGLDGTITVKYDENDADSQIKLIREYAEKFNLYPYYDFRWPKLSEFVMICTNMSSGSPIELANWFVEVGGFRGSYAGKLSLIVYD